LLSLDLESLMAIEVSVATKTAQSLSDTTSAVSVISRVELQASGSASILEALRLVSGINVRWNPMMQTVTIRGFGQNPFSNRVLMLIDGIPYNSWNKGGFPQQPGFDFFNIENVKQIEVIKGPSSSLYGENAYWGVINIVSISGKDLKGARLKAKTGSRQTREISAQIGDEWANGDWLASVKWLQSEFPTKL
jgi:iron complex outermembrane receptor protein